MAHSLRPEVPYPSFTLVLSRIDNDTLRLPAYRESYLRRHHPYARRTPRRHDHLMTVDYRYDEEPVIAIPSPPVGQADSNDDLTNLHLALHADEKEPIRRRRSISSLIVDLALAVQRKCQRVRIVKKLSPPTKSDLLN